MNQKKLEINELKQKRKFNHDKRLSVMDLLQQQLIELNEDIDNDNNSSQCLLSKMNEQWENDKQEMMKEIDKLNNTKNQKFKKWK